MQNLLGDFGKDAVYKATASNTLTKRQLWNLGALALIYYFATPDRKREKEQREFIYYPKIFV